MSQDNFKFEIAANIDEKMWFIEPAFATNGIPTNFSLHEGCVAEINTGSNAITVFSMIKCTDEIVTIPQQLTFKGLKAANTVNAELKKAVKEKRFSIPWTEEAFKISQPYVKMRKEIVMNFKPGDKTSADEETWYEVKRVGIQIVSKKYVTNRFSHVYYYCREIKDDKVIAENVQIDSQKLGVHNIYMIRDIEIKSDIENEGVTEAWHIK